MPESYSKVVGPEYSEKMKQAWLDYEDTMKRIADGTFPVKVGSKVYRVIGGLRVGSQSADLTQGDNVMKNYATPHISSIKSIVQANDEEQYYHDGSPFDRYQRIAVIEVQDFEIPYPDITHALHADKDQIIVTGKVLEILSPNDFFEKYRGEIT